MSPEQYEEEIKALWTDIPDNKSRIQWFKKVVNSSTTEDIQEFKNELLTLVDLINMCQDT